MSIDGFKKVVPNPEFSILENEFNNFIEAQQTKKAEENLLNTKNAARLSKEDEDYWEDENWFEDQSGKYRASHLWAAAKGLPVKQVKILDIFNPEEWKKEIKESDPKYYKEELERVEKADLSYPIILTPSSKIADGFHRAMKAYLRGDKTIDAIQLLKMPGAKKSSKKNIIEEIKQATELLDTWLIKNSADDIKLKEEGLIHPIEDIESAALREHYGNEPKGEPDIKKLKEELEKEPDKLDEPMVDEKTNIVDAKNKLKEQLHGKLWLKGIGIGESHGEPAIKVNVDKLTNEISKEVPEHIDNIKVILDEVGEIRVFDDDLGGEYFEDE
jgi:hypothetical protein